MMRLISGALTTQLPGQPLMMKMKPPLRTVSLVIAMTTIPLKIMATVTKKMKLMVWNIQTMTTMKTVSPL